MKDTHSRSGWLRRFAAMALTLAALMQGGTLTQTSRAIEANPATGTISLYRWDRYDDVTKLPHRTFGRLLLTWSDNGARYYFRMKIDQAEWTGAKYGGAYKMSDNLVSSQPLMESALNSGSPTFFTTDAMDVGFYYGVGDGNSSVQFRCALDPDRPYAAGRVFRYWYNSGYHDENRELMKTEPGDAASWWRFVNSGSGLQLRSYGDGPHSYMRHNANQITARANGSLSTQFDKPYLCTEYKEISSIPHDFTVESGTVTSLSNRGTYLNPRATLTVKNGGMLIVGGLLLNDGKLVVEPGGLLVLKEGATIMPFSRTDERCGGVSSRGNIVVRKNAKLVGGGVTGIELMGGSVVNFGLIAGENFHAANAYQIDNRVGGTIFAGKTPDHASGYAAMTANLDKKPPYPNASIQESSAVTILKRGAVFLAERSVRDRGGTVKNFGSFGG